MNRFVPQVEDLNGARAALTQQKVSAKIYRQKRLLRIEQVKNPQSCLLNSNGLQWLPDGVQRSLVGQIISRFENKGYKLVAFKLVAPSQAHLEKHYSDLAGKPFFPGLIKYMLSGPIAAMVWEGKDVVKTGRVLLGATNPLASAPGTIRGDFAIDVGRNVCHGSDSVESAKKEIDLWFSKDEIITYKQAGSELIYE